MASQKKKLKPKEKHSSIKDEPTVSGNSQTSKRVVKKKKSGQVALSNDKRRQGETDPFPVTGKPSNDIDTAKVTMDEVEYQRLREIEDRMKELFALAKKVNGAVAFGHLSAQYKEPKLITRLRELLGVEPYVRPKA